MVTVEQNERWTRVGPGTPCGELMRRYWHPLCPSGELTAETTTKKVRILGEDLVVFRTPDGTFGCVEESCAHRRVSLFYGFVEDGGIRCCYHGWKYDSQGRCVEQPFEPGEGFKDRVRIKAYPVEKLGGLLFVYMGPDLAKAPLLPRWDVIAREDGERFIKVFPPLRCNWLQCEENTADLTHTYYLHGHMDAALNLNVLGASYFHRPIVKCDWSYCEWGLDKVVHYGGDQPDVEVRPPLIFPNILRIPISEPGESIHWRVPVDDTNTRVVWVEFFERPEGGKRTAADGDAPFEYQTRRVTENGDYDLSSFYTQDEMAWETQGSVVDRTKETLGASDRGIVMFRKLLDEQISRVQSGEEPNVAVVRDPEKNRLIEFPGHTVPGLGTARPVGG